MTLTLLLAATMGGGAAAKDPGATPGPVTLTLGVADGDANDSRPAVDRFVASVAERSGGSIAIVPTFDAGGEGFEQATIDRILAGDFDLGLVGGRAWIAHGIPGMAALHAPMLIDDTALAVSVSRGEAGSMALDQLSASPVTGLALWPESLRYFFAYPSYRHVLSPTDLRGAVVKTDVGGPGQPFVEALRGSVWTGTDINHDVDLGIIEVQDSNMHGRGLALGEAVGTGNVVLYPKLQTLVASDEAFATLTPEQQDILRGAADDSRETGISTVADEVAWSKDWCAGSGAVVLADDTSVAAFHEVAATVTDQLRADPTDAAIIAAVEALKATTPRSPQIEACSADDGRVPYPATDTTGWNGGLPPDGSYRAEITRDELLSRGVTPQRASANTATSTWIFDGTTATLASVQSGRTYRCQATLEPAADGTHTVFTDLPGGQCGIGYWMAWKPAKNGIKLLVVVGPDVRVTPGEAYDINEYKAIMEDRVWTRID